jgi:phosphatidyl-myo-inositol alpha-mannosyltransferase
VRIAHVSPYDHQVSGGVREHVINLERQHRAMGHEVTVIAPASRRDGLASNVVCISDFVVPVRGSGSIARISLSPLVYARIGHVLREGRFDVVHLHEPLMPVVSLFALMRSRAVTVGTIHGYRERYFVYQALRPVLGRLIARLSARIAVSSDARAWASRYFPGEYHLIPDGVDIERFCNPEVRPVPRLDDGKLNILFVGRLEQRKGFPYLLRAFGAIKSAVPDARLVVVGHFSREQAAPHVDYARRHGLRDVDFVGFVDGAELPRYYRSAHVFCAPSTGFEALGIVLLEALAAGTAVVTTNIEGYRTVVTNEHDALVVPPKDSPALARAIITLLQDGALRRQLISRGRETVRQYAWPSVAARIVRLYEECLSARR